MDFSTLQSNVSRVIKDLDKIVLDSAMELKDTIADLNVKQLEDGKRENGNSIVPEYQSPNYAKTKKAIGARPTLGTPDLKLTGDFHSGIYADLRGNYIYTYSTDSKADSLNSRYRQIFGLTKESIAALKPDLTKILQNRLENELQAS